MFGKSDSARESVGFRPLSERTPCSRETNRKNVSSRGSWALVAVLALCLMSSAGGSAKAGDISANDGAYPPFQAGV